MLVDVLHGGIEMFNDNVMVQNLCLVRFRWKSNLQSGDRIAIDQDQDHVFNPKKGKPCSEVV